LYSNCVKENNRRSLRTFLIPKVVFLNATQHFSSINIFSLFLLLDAIKAAIDANGDGLESNWEFFVAMDPNNMYGNDYVWDHFNWDHCA
jgi:hypothetical protein